MTVKQSKEFIFQLMSTGNKRPWDDGSEGSDQHYLLAHHKDMYVEDIAEHLNRTVKATKHKATRMGCSFKSKPKVSN